MANTLRAEGKVEQALVRLKEALTLADRTLGSDDDTASTIALNLGMILMDLRRYPEAEGYLRRSIDSATARLGSKHPDVADRRRVLAIALYYQQQPSKALAEREQALPILEASLGRDNNEVSMLVYTMADILRHSKRCNEAVPYYRRAIAYAEHALGENDPFRPYPLFGLGRCLDHMGQGIEAVELLTHARSFALKAQNASPQDVALIDLATSHALAQSDRRRARTLATAARAAIPRDVSAEDYAEEAEPMIEELVEVGVLPASAGNVPIR
jgi:eukaryotic-like serine/threonine-protein kinase